MAKAETYSPCWGCEKSTTSCCCPDLKQWVEKRDNEDGQMKYEWKQLSQWDCPKPEYYVESREVSTGMSKATCVFLLVECVDQGRGYIRTIPITKADVTGKMIDIANTANRQQEG